MNYVDPWAMPEDLRLLAYTAVHTPLGDSQPALNILCDAVLERGLELPPFKQLDPDRLGEPLTPLELVLEWARREFRPKYLDRGGLYNVEVTDVRIVNTFRGNHTLVAHFQIVNAPATPVTPLGRIYAYTQRLDSNYAIRDPFVRRCIRFTHYVHDEILAEAPNLQAAKEFTWLWVQRGTSRKTGQLYWHHTWFAGDPRHTWFAGDPPDYKNEARERLLFQSSAGELEYRMLAAMYQEDD